MTEPEHCTCPLCGARATTTRNAYLWELERSAERTRRYVAACLAIRAAPYPSEEFSRAVEEAGAAYRALVRAYELAGECV